MQNGAALDLSALSDKPLRDTTDVERQAVAELIARSQIDLVDMIWWMYFRQVQTV